jgi:hypothetical protein
MLQSTLAAFRSGRSNEAGQIEIQTLQRRWVLLQTLNRALRNLKDAAAQATVQVFGSRARNLSQWPVPRERFQPLSLANASEQCC